MKKKSTSQSAFFNLRVLIGSVLCLTGIFVAMLGMGTFSSAFAQRRGATNQDAPGTQTPDVVRMVGPVRWTWTCATFPGSHQKPRTKSNPCIDIRAPHSRHKLRQDTEPPAWHAFSRC